MVQLAETHRSRQPRRGSVLLLTLVLLPLMLVTAAIAMEAGHAGNFRGDLQNAVDAAAKAGSYRVGDGPSVAKAAARDALAEAGWPESILESLTIEYGRWDDQTRTFTKLTTKSDDANAINVVARAEVDALFGHVAGVSGWMSTQQAVSIRPGIALAIKNRANFVANDQTMYNFLKTFGVPLRILEQDELNANCIIEGELLFISSSVSSSRVDESVRHVPGPVLVGETNLYDTFQFTNGQDHVTHGNTYVQGMDVEIDLYDMDENANTWRAKWQEWWKQMGKYKTKGNVSFDESSPDPEDHRVKDTKASTSINAPHGYAKRTSLTQDAIIIATAASNENEATVFWYDAGARKHGGTTAKYRQAGVFIRTNENSHHVNYTYSSDSYALLGQTIRWMLMDQEGRTALVR
jgi:Flp pilus assembly protein TadG